MPRPPLETTLQHLADPVVAESSKRFHKNATQGDASTFLGIRIPVLRELAKRAQIYTLYLDHTAFLNSWDLVDASAYFIVGPYLEKKDRQPLYQLAKSQSLWERRIAMLAPLHFIRKGDFDDTLRLAEVLLHDKEDLIHKVVGWMLKEIGNRDRQVADTFLRKHYRDMHRTTLRYALKKYPQKERQAYLTGNA